MTKIASRGGGPALKNLRAVESEKICFNEWGLCEFVQVHTKLPPGPVLVILWIELNWIELNIYILQGLPDSEH